MRRFALEPRTDAGQKFVALAEEHAADFATRAAEHDKDGTFPFEAIDAMKASGFAAGPIAEEFGGLGVASAHDVMVGVSRLARGDASVAIAINMHLAVCTIVTRMLRGAQEAGNTEEVATVEGFLGLLGGGAIAMANTTEAGTNIRFPMTEAKFVDEGVRIDGRKSFGTLSEVADVFLVTCRHQTDDGSWQNGRAIVFRGLPGQTVLDNWDALGMRASGSHDVVYENRVVPAELFTSLGEWGALDSGLLLIAAGGNIGLLGAFLGIAETARDYIAELLVKRTKHPSGAPIADRAGIQHGMAELEIDLATCRAHLAWISRYADEIISERPVASVTDDDLTEVGAMFQASKFVVNRNAIDVVDTALQLSGGAGYMSSNPLGRYYRDVRAGPFMQPFSPNEVHEFIGKVSLGRPLDLEA